MVNLNLRLPDDLHKKLVKRKFDTDVSINQQIVIAVANDLNKK